MPEEAPVVERGVVSLSDVTWEEARQRVEVIGPSASRRSISHAAADAAGEQLGLSRRQIYALATRWRQGSG
jgi:putative transposase